MAMDGAEATRNFIGALNWLLRLSGPGHTQAAFELYSERTARDGLRPLSRAAFYDTLGGERVRCPDWSDFCRPLILGCFEAALKPHSAAYLLGLDLGSEKAWRRFHDLSSSGFVTPWPFDLPESSRAPGLSEEERVARAKGEAERARVLRGQGVLITLGNLYPDYPLTELWSATYPITTFPAPPEEWGDIESPLGAAPFGQRLPDRLEYSPEWNPGAGRKTFDENNRKYDHASEEQRRAFFSGSTYAFGMLRHEGHGVRLDADLGRYFASHATSERLDPEMMSALAEAPDQPVSLTVLEQRRWLHKRVPDPVVDGRHRAGALSHATVVLNRNPHGGYDLLLPFRSDAVAAHSHFNHVAPSGILSPHSEQPYPPDLEFSVERNFFREWVEELYAADDHERPPFTNGPDPEHEPEVVRLKAALEAANPVVHLRYTGVSVNLLTLRPEICLLLLIDDPDWLPHEMEVAAQGGRPWTFGWEYSNLPAEIRRQSPNQPEHSSIDLDPDLCPSSGTTFTPDFLVPNAAAAIALAIPVVRKLAAPGSSTSHA